ncbi:unnamed protein product [Ceutorhynchus assimilis]|uniref:Large ribosomal subunit protein mL64 n=1 Tax=Ceutorhynchus assimilis TaxID=467358 RepID=A0A9N9QH04_9CUCU|nr:unnamed protein product [Ceutorhynchus assimilis]
MALLYGADNELKQQIAIGRRANIDGLAEEQVNAESRLCLNCHRSILREVQNIENNPASMRLNVLKQTSMQTCLICNSMDNVHRLSLKCRVDVFIRQNIFIPTGTRSCNHHLDEDGLLLSFLLPALQFINHPYLVPGPELVIFLQEIRSIARGVNKWLCCEKDLNEEEFRSVVGLSKEHFTDLYTFCHPVRTENLAERETKKLKSIFWCKLLTSRCDEELQDAIEYEKVKYPFTVPQMMKEAAAKREEKDKMAMQRQQDIAKKMEKLEQWKEELHSKIEKKESEAMQAKMRKDRLIEEVRRHFGYTVDPKDDRFKELLEKKEKEQKKAMKEARKKAKEEKMVKMLLNKKDKATQAEAKSEE